MISFFLHSQFPTGWRLKVLVSIIQHLSMVSHNVWVSPGKKWWDFVKKVVVNAKVRALSKNDEDFVHLQPEGHRAIKDSFHLSPGEPWEPAEFFWGFSYLLIVEVFNSCWLTEVILARQNIAVTFLCCRHAVSRCSLTHKSSKSTGL